MTHRQQRAPVFGKTIPLPQPLANSQSQQKAQDFRAVLLIQMCELHAHVITATVERKLSTQVLPASCSLANHQGQPQFQDWLKKKTNSNQKQKPQRKSLTTTNQPKQYIWGEHLRAIQLLPNQRCCFKGFWAARQQLEAEISFLNHNRGRSALELGIALNWRQGQGGAMIGLKRSCSEWLLCRLSPVGMWGWN